MIVTQNILTEDDINYYIRESLIDTEYKESTEAVMDCVLNNDFKSAQKLIEKHKHTKKDVKTDFVNYDLNRADVHYFINKLFN